MFVSLAECTLLPALWQTGHRTISAELCVLLLGLLRSLQALVVLGFYS